ncbi:hypothetical protein GIB67_008137, partial [Kingdonia uniflora]
PSTDGRSSLHSLLKCIEAYLILKNGSPEIPQRRTFDTGDEPSGIDQYIAAGILRPYLHMVEV